jgi:hypothetical protein
MAGYDLIEVLTRNLGFLESKKFLELPVAGNNVVILIERYNG